MCIHSFAWLCVLLLIFRATSMGTQGVAHRCVPPIQHFGRGVWHILGMSQVAGLSVELDRGLRLEVLHPGVELLTAEGYNANSIVTRLSHGSASVLLTGDITAEVEGMLLASGWPLRSAVL